jgi:hypothetical protein
MMAATRYESKTKYKQWVQRISLIHTFNLSEQRYGKVMQKCRYIKDLKMIHLYPKTGSQIE